MFTPPERPRAPTAADPRPRWILASWLLVTLAFAVWLWGSVAAAAPPTGSIEAADTEDSDAPVRTGTTQVTPPAPESAQQPGSAAGQSPAPRKGPQVRYVAPSDAPRISGTGIKLPPPPDAFNTHDAGWIRFAYPPAVRKHVQPLIAEADAIRTELRARMGTSVLNEVSVYIGRSPGEMRALAPKGAPYPSYASGVAYSKLGLILLTIAPLNPNSRHDLAEIFRHELAHVALYDAVGNRPVPRWFNEGFAVFVSGEGSIVRFQTLSTATLSGNLLPLDQLERSFPNEPVTASVAYAQAADLVRFLVRRQDQHRFGALVRRMSKGQTFDQALQDAYGTDVASLEFEWREDVKKRYTYWPILTSGVVIWVAMIGLIAWVWRRRRRRAQATLERWTREEAAADALVQQQQLMGENRRVHIVVARSNQPAPASLQGRFPEPDVPKVEHKGDWHTLH